MKMKISYVVLEQSGTNKKVQIDLIVESAQEKDSLNRKFTPELQDYVLLYANSLFPGFSVVYTLDSSNSPRRTVVLMEKTAGFGA